MIDLCESDVADPTVQLHIEFGRATELNPSWDIYDDEKEVEHFPYAFVTYHVEENVGQEQDVNVFLISKTEAQELHAALSTYLHEDFEASRKACA